MSNFSCRISHWVIVRRINTKNRTSFKPTAIKYCVKYTVNHELPTYSLRARANFKQTLRMHQILNGHIRFFY